MIKLQVLLVSDRREVWTSVRHVLDPYFEVVLATGAPKDILDVEKKISPAVAIVDLSSTLLKPEHTLALLRASRPGGTTISVFDRQRGNASVADEFHPDAIEMGMLFPDLALAVREAMAIGIRVPYPETTLAVQ